MCRSDSGPDASARTAVEVRLTENTSVAPPSWPEIRKFAPQSVHFCSPREHSQRVFGSLRDASCFHADAALWRVTHIRHRSARACTGKCIQCAREETAKCALETKEGSEARTRGTYITFKSCFFASSSLSNSSSSGNVILLRSSFSGCFGAGRPALKKSRKCFVAARRA